MIGCTTLMPALVALLMPALQEPRLDSGTPPPAEQRCYDVLHYDLALDVDPAKHSISGTLLMRARVLEKSDSILLDLDDRLTVSAVTRGKAPLAFTREPGRIRVRGIKELQSPGADFELVVAYSGIPREAPNAPWDGGFTWKKTASGAPWIATTCQGEGADIWWPCKDQPDDEPDSMDIAIRVPEPLVVASNGRLVDVQKDERGARTYHWHVSTPINAYSVAIDIAPYDKIEGELTSSAGERFPVVYYVLPENLEQGKRLFEEIKLDLAFFESTCGPYPFRADKYGVVETPHLGMEQQTITAYGNRYRGNPWGAQQGFDFLLHHEMAHEWWGLLVTARNWNDFWIHEGIGTYMQALYAEKLKGPAAYRQVMSEQRRSIANNGALAPRDPHSSGEMYTSEIWKDSPGGDIYTKGSWVMHSLRWLLGDECFFRVLRRFAYPDPALEQVTDGRACRFATTDELLAIAEKESGVRLGWFWEIYLRQAKLPKLSSSVVGDELRLTWETPGELPFPMPVELRIGEKTQRVEMRDGRANVPLHGAKEFVLDPDERVLRDSASPRGPRAK
ncbi:MAG: M1 family metallopeptidase [Planctomycetes bacterium]|nr:M1 family metallopeptidase [Planctomycetota bacterium]